MNINLDNSDVNKNKGGMFLMCIVLHLICAQASGWHYNLLELWKHFDLDDCMSVLSGAGSIATAWVLVQHYYLRNKLLRKEVKNEKTRKGVEKEEEQKDNA